MDEFGKNLEFQAHHSDQGDIFALQALAESEGIFLWVCLHQAFQAYAGIFEPCPEGGVAKKYRDVFEDRPYIEPPTRSFTLIRDAFVRGNAGCGL